MRSDMAPRRIARCGETASVSSVERRVVVARPGSLIVAVDGGGLLSLYSTSVARSSKRAGDVMRPEASLVVTIGGRTPPVARELRELLEVLESLRMRVAEPARGAEPAALGLALAASASS